MRRTKTLAALVLATALVAGLAAPAAGAVGSDTDERSESLADGFASANETADSSVNVTVGQQLSTVVAATSDEVRTDFEETAFEVSYESANDSERADAVADRADALGERAADIRESYRDATEAFRAGELNESEYAQRIAVLNARAENVVRSAERLRKRADNVSALELRAAGVDRASLDGLGGNLSAVTGAGPSAVLARYTGQTDGELSIQADDGLAVEAESEDGERSLEVERPRDGDDAVTVDQSAALDTARARLGSAPDNGTWALAGSSMHADSGYYEFEFALRGANATGEAEVRVDGSSGSVFRLEQEVESADESGDDAETEAGGEREADDDERENESEDDRELALVVADGTPAPNATITVKALSAGEPAANATVSVDGERVGTTGADGTLAVTLPSGSATVEAVSGEREAELELEFEERDDDPFRKLNVSGDVRNGTVTVSATYDGAPVSGATVSVDGERVGTTDADGTVRFDIGASDDIDVEIAKGEFEAELAFDVTGDRLTLTESPRESDGEREDERESEDEDEQEDETTEVEDEPTEEDDGDEDEQEDEDDEKTGETTEDDDDD